MKLFYFYFYFQKIILLLILTLVFFFLNVDKGRELTEAQAEIKALRFSERLREKAVEEVL